MLMEQVLQVKLKCFNNGISALFKKNHSNLRSTLILPYFDYCSPVWRKRQEEQKSRMEQGKRQQQVKNTSHRNKRQDFGEVWRDKKGALRGERRREEITKRRRSGGEALEWLNKKG